MIIPLRSAFLGLYKTTASIQGRVKYSIDTMGVFAMKKLEIKAGREFGRLTVIKETEKTKKERNFICSCSCGSIERPYRLSMLRAGRTKSCGCLRSEATGNRSRKHGMDGTRLYRVWCSMKERCYSSTNDAYSNYGGKGVTVCAEWQEFAPFMIWANSNGYEQGLHIDREDGRLGYSPDNCRFITQEKNNQNRKNSRKWHVGGGIFDSASLAAKANGVTVGVVKHWAGSEIKKVHPSIGECFSERLYV